MQWDSKHVCRIQPDLFSDFGSSRCPWGPWRQIHEEKTWTPGGDAAIPCDVSRDCAQVDRAEWSIVLAGLDRRFRRRLMRTFLASFAREAAQLCRMDRDSGAMGEGPSLFWLQTHSALIYFFE